MLYVLNKFNNNIQDINLLIYKISKVILLNYNKDIVNQFVYNKNLSKLDEVSLILDKIPKKINLKDFRFNYIVKLDKCTKILIDVSKECGIDKLSSLGADDFCITMATKTKKPVVDQKELEYMLLKVD